MSRQDESEEQLQLKCQELLEEKDVSGKLKEELQALNAGAAEVTVVHLDPHRSCPVDHTTFSLMSSKPSVTDAGI